MAGQADRSKESEGPRYRKAYPVFWTDERVIELPPDEKLIAIHCFTSQQCNRIGIFPFSLGMAAEQTGLPLETFREGFLRVVESLDWKWDSKRRVLYLTSWWKWNQPENPNVLIGNLKDLCEVPKSHLVQEFEANLEYLKTDLHETFTYTLGKRYPKPSPNQEQEQEQEQEQKQDKEAQALAQARAALKDLDWGSVFDTCTKVAKTVKPLNGRAQDRSQVIKSVVLSRSVFTEDWLWDAVDRVQRKKRVRNPMALFHRMLADSAAEQGLNLNRLMSEIILPPEVLEPSRPPPNGESLEDKPP